MELLEYMQMIYQLEATCLQLDTLLQTLEARLAALPGKPERPRASGWPAGALCAALGLGCCYEALFTSQPVMPGVFAGIVGFWMLCAGASLLWDAQKIYRKEKAAYGSAQSAYVQSQPLREAVERELLFLQRKRRETDGLLQAAYDENVILPQYRNLAAVSALCGYLISQRCRDLEGPGGAYSLYAAESPQEPPLLQAAMREAERIASTLSGAVQMPEWARIPAFAAYETELTKKEAALAKKLPLYKQIVWKAAGEGKCGSSAGVHPLETVYRE